MRSRINFTILIPLFILVILQFVNIPFLGDIHTLGKVYVFFFSFMPYLLIKSFKNTGVFFFPRVCWLLIGIWSLLGIFSFFAYQKFAAWQLLCVLAALIVWCLIFVNLTARDSIFFRRFCEALIVIGVFCSILGLYEYNYFICVGSSQEMLIPFLLPPNFNIRVAGVYGQSNLFALLMTVTFLVLVYYFIHHPPKYRFRFLAWSRLLLPGLISLNFFLTLSRAGLIAFVFCLLILLWLVGTGRYLADNKSGRKEFFFLLGCVFLAFGFAKLLPFIAGYGNLGRALGADIGQNISSRFVYFVSALLMFFDHPWHGIGFDNFKFLLAGYELYAHDLLGIVEYEAMTPTDWTHNEILQLLCEGGIFVGIGVLSLLGIYLWKFYKALRKSKMGVSPVFLYSHLLVMPFVVQAMFSWPLRHFPLVIIFFALLGIVFAQYPLAQIKFNRSGKAVAAGFIVAGMMLTGAGFAHELELGRYRRLLADKNISLIEKFPAFEDLAHDPYSEFRVLKSVLWKFVGQLNSTDEHISAEKLLPYAQRLIEIQGTSSQWYNLALIHIRLDDRNAARSAATKAVEINPVNDTAWDLIHFINVLDAAEQTGRTIESFYSGQSSEEILQLLESLNE